MESRPGRPPRRQRSDSTSAWAQRAAGDRPKGENPAWKVPGERGRQPPVPPGSGQGLTPHARPFGTDSECIVASGGRGCQGARERPALPTAASGPHTGGRRRTAEACETVIGGNGDEHARAATGAGAVAGRHRPGIALGRPAMVGISAPPTGHAWTIETALEDGRHECGRAGADRRSWPEQPDSDEALYLLGTCEMARGRIEAADRAWAARAAGFPVRDGVDPGPTRNPAERGRFAEMEQIIRDALADPSSRRDRACPSRSGPSGAFRAAWRRPCVSSRHGGMS